jgi:protein TonB
MLGEDADPEGILIRMKLGLRRVWLERRNAVASAGVHLGLLSLLLSNFHFGPKVAPYRLPGTETGVRTLTYFSSGNPQPHTIDAPVKDAKLEKKALDTAHDALQPAKPASAPAAQADAGSGDAVKSGVGEGNITIALQKFFPYPKPDLSSMAHGASGDVILDAVIDEHGRISALTLLKGLGDPIDKNVIATVEQWSYTPAMKDGVPVASEQELHFHYERG